MQTRPVDRDALQRRTLVVVVCSQVFGGAGLAAGVTVGALLAADLLGSDGAAGLPAALFTLGSAAAAFTVGRVSQRAGRRRGLSGGFLAGALGAVGVVVAASVGSAALLLASLLVYGAGTATNLQARYAGTDLAAPHDRGRAVSIALVATTFGAVAGPNTVGLTGRLAGGVGIPALAGPFLLAAVAYAVAGAVIWVWLRPDPLLVAQQEAATPDDPVGPVGPVDPVDPVGPDNSDTGGVHSSSRGVVLGAAIMVLTQVAMVAIMTMTPVHMRAHGHGLGAVGFVIGLHIGAMYLPSLVTGRLVDSIGRIPMALAAAATLLAAGVVAAVAPGGSLVVLTLALVLLGLGWNFGLISGTALLIDSTPLASRARTQGNVDVLVALAGAGGGVMSGLVVTATSYAVLALVGGALALLVLPAVVWQRRASSVEDPRLREPEILH